MSNEINLAIFGANSLIGDALLDALKTKKITDGELFILEEEVSESLTFSYEDHDIDEDDEAISQTISYRFLGKTIYPQAIDEFDWSQVQMVFFAADEPLAAKWAPIAAEAGVIVIDASSQYRDSYDVPLVVPDVNSSDLADFRSQNIIATPSSLATQLALILKPIQEAAGITSVTVSTYQSVSNAGKAGIDELAGQTARLLNGIPAEPVCYPEQIAFNCIPQVDQLEGNGYSRSEMAMVAETQKLLNDQGIKINVTCVQVPVFYGDAMSIFVQTYQPITETEAKEALLQMNKIKVFDDGTYPTQVKDGKEKDCLMVGRLRNELDSLTGLHMWVTSDNLRQGMANNMLDIAERLLLDYY